MNDISQHLPLSQRPTVDESQVTGDWRPQIGRCLTLVADLLTVLPPEGWEAPSLCSGWTVRDVAGHLVWFFGGTRRQLVGDILRTSLRGRLGPASAVSVLARRHAEAEPAELIRMLHGLAETRVGGGGRHSIGDLTEVVVHGFDLAAALGVTLVLPPIASGAVAVARAARASGHTRALLRARTLAATDGDWSVGRGPLLSAPSEALIPMLFGRDVPTEPLGRDV